MIYSKISIYILTCLDTKKQVIFKCENPTEYIFYKKDSLKNTDMTQGNRVLQNIITNNNFVYELIKKYENVEKDDLQIEIKRFSREENISKINEKSICELQRLQEELFYNQRRYEGLIKEDVVKQRVEKIFMDKLIHSSYEYSHYDYEGKKLFYEMKSIKNMYPNVFLGTDKIICENLVIIYTFDNLPNQRETGLSRLFYIKYDNKLFSTFEKKYVKPPNRLYYNEVYSIPKSFLIEIKDTDRVVIETIDENELRDEIIKKDKMLFIKNNK